MHRNFKTCLASAAGLCFLLMALGSFVRAADAGLACPDWPLCFDQPIPFFDTKIFLEWFHRVVAGAFSLGLASLWIYSLVKPDLRQRVGLILSSAIVLLVLQVMLGALTVWELLLPSVVASHLMNAVLILATLILAHSRLGRAGDEMSPPPTASPFFAKVIVAFSSLVFIQIWLGGMVSSNEAGLMCPDFPTCYGQWFPRVGPLVDLHLAHRYMAFVVLMLALLVNASASGAPKIGWLRQFCRYAPVMVAMQIALGVYNIYYALPVWASGTHLALALVIFSGAIATSCRVWQLKLINQKSIIKDDTDVVDAIQESVFEN